MKSFRWTLLFLIVVGVIATFTFYDFKKAGEEGESKDKAKSVLRFTPEQVQHFELITRLTTTVLDRKGEQWLLTAGDLKDFADPTTVNNFLLVLSNEKFAQTVTEGTVDADPRIYGLDQPLTRMKLVTADGQTQELKIGSVKAYDGSLYMQIEGEKAVRTVGTNWDAYLSKKVNDLRDKHLVRADLKDAKRIEIRAGSKLTELTLADKNWKLTKGSRLSEYPVSNERVAGYFEALKTLRASDFVSAAGLSKIEKPAFEVQVFGDKPEPLVRLLFSQVLPSVKFAPNSKIAPPPEKVQASSSDLKELTEMPKVLAEGANRSAQDFYDLKLPFRLGGAEAATEKIDLLFSGEAALKAEFVKKGETWQPVNAGLHTDVDAAKLDELIKKLGTLEAAQINERTTESAKSSRGLNQHIRLTKASGELLFELSWSKPAGPTVEAHTNLVEPKILVNTVDLKALEDLIRPPKPKKDL